MLENKFKTKLKKEIEERFPGSMVVHLDPNEIQGIPDLVVFYKSSVKFLEQETSIFNPQNRFR